ncbi:nucleotidyltransferase family protein [Natronosporangium hydrolyticum]|uniref:Nucleotidyltransferase family protein n=1 Tax=Natronosporangium hydrolyticum TaxID=2811111 RepID=A0A895YHN7_9ACTN|nr:nucleotidyltransferase family protein [Natronosporangium hydrolyticum]QSB17357.1 nucleotidyltransferase family protein [Natronosporangium hydrolyticum]
MVLAGGSGRRLGRPKALLRSGDGLLVERALRTMQAAGCAPLVVVLGAAADQVQAEAELSDATVVVNKAWSTGMASSLRVGLQTVADAGAESVILVPVDMPGITPEAVQLVGAEPSAEALVCGTYEGRRSYPVLLGRAHFAGVETLASADVGVRPYLLARAAQLVDVACDQVATGEDIDTPDEASACGIELTPNAD